MSSASTDLTDGRPGAGDWPHEDRSIGTLLDLFRARAATHPQTVAYIYLKSGEEQAERLSYGELDRTSRAIASTLRVALEPGERAVLVYPPGLDFIAAFLGCVYAGVIAVPVPAPHPARLDRDLPRVLRVAENCTASALLGPRSICERLPDAAWSGRRGDERTLLATDTVDPRRASDWKPPATTSDTVALLQYTSGSTAAPRGVIVSHGNLIANLSAIHGSEGNTQDSVSVTWLPHYHDMGLIEGLLLPAYSTIPAYVMPSTAFLQRPIRWLQAISRYGATNSGGPNFAYDLCVEKTSKEQRRDLDLGRWRVAYNGSEPIRASTIRRFTAAFRGCGFSAEAVRTVYGLAEATLLVSASREGRAPCFVPVCADTLESDQVALPASNGRSVEAVSCGPPVKGVKVAIVDPLTRRRVADRQIGELWLSGPGVARGYWGDVESTESVFAARLGRDGGRRYLRSGDLGFTASGELFITGRIKDLIIVRGRKLHPHDIELTVEQSHERIRRGAVAAFSIRDAPGERLLVMAELVRHREAAGQPNNPAETAAYEDIAATIVQSVTEEHGVAISNVCLVPMGTVPKTSSGKIQRSLCRARFVEEGITVLHHWTRPGADGLVESRRRVRRG